MLFVRKVHVRIIPGHGLKSDRRVFQKRGHIYYQQHVDKILEQVVDFIDKHPDYKQIKFKMVEVGKGRFNFIGMTDLEAEQYMKEQAEAEAEHEKANLDSDQADG